MAAAALSRKQMMALIVYFSRKIPTIYIFKKGENFMGNSVQSLVENFLAGLRLHYGFLSSHSESDQKNCRNWHQSMLLYSYERGQNISWPFFAKIKRYAGSKVTKLTILLQ